MHKGQLLSPDRKFLWLGSAWMALFLTSGSTCFSWYLRHKVISTLLYSRYCLITHEPWNSPECHHLGFLSPQHLYPVFNIYSNQGRSFSPSWLAEDTQQHQKTGGTASPELFWKDYLCISITIFPLNILHHAISILLVRVHSKISLTFPPCGIKLPAGARQEKVVSFRCRTQIWKHGITASEKGLVLPIFSGKSQT